MTVAWLRSRKGPSDSPPQGAKDGPSSAYPLALRAGRSANRALLPRRRRLPNPQPPPQALRVPQEALGLGGHLACAPAAAPWRGERALVLARCAEVLLPPVPRGSGDVPFLLQPAGEETQALPGAPAAADRPRARRRPRDPRGGFDAAFGVAPAPGRAVGGLRGSGLGEVGFVQRLRGQAAPALRYQPGSRLLRAHPRQRGGRLPERGTRSRGGFGGGVARKLFGDLAYRSEALEEALAPTGILLVSERSRQHGNRQQVEIALASLKREFRLEGTLATTLVGLLTRIAAKVTAYTYGFFVDRLLGRPQGRIKELWA